MSRRGGTERMTALLANACCERYQVVFSDIEGEGVFP